MNSRIRIPYRVTLALAVAIVASALGTACRHGTASSTRCATSGDCAGIEVCLEGVCRRPCVDDDDCPGTNVCANGLCGIDDGLVPCSPTDPPRACTPLPEDLWHVVGVGACYIGAQRCLDTGEWEATCDGGVPTPEAADNNIDDDCDGVVDEGSHCAPAGSTRPCFLGVPPEQVAATVKGECVAGVQACEPDTVNGDRWGTACLGEVPPQRAAVDSSVGGDDVGFGFAELGGAVVAATQCDGIDNDCDGLFDEEPWFDTDADGYTVCGTTFTPDPLAPSRNTFAVGGTGSQNIDCDDADATVTPGLYFGYDAAGTCSYCLPALLGACDPLVATCVSESARPTCKVPDTGTCVGATAPRWSRAAAAGQDPYGDCTLAIADCATSAGGEGPFFDGLFDLTDDGVDNPICYFKTTPADNTCDGLGACRTRTEECLAAGRGAAMVRPICVTFTSGCTGTTPPAAVAFGEDPSNDCATEGLGCCPLAPGAPACCKALGSTCTSGTECASHFCVEGVCCNSACTGTCYSCTVTLNGVAGGTCLPIATQSQDSAPTNLCTATSNTCGGGACICEPDTGVCKKGNGTTCVADVECASGQCECADATCSAKMCSAADCSCKYSDGTACVGNIADGGNDADDTCGTLTCDGSGLCHLADGAGCTAASRCESNYCVDGYCCNSSCSAACYSCSAQRTASPSGVCAVFDVQQPDTAPTSLCTSSGIGCDGTACECAPNLGLCKRAAGQSCTIGTECASGICATVCQ